MSKNRNISSGFDAPPGVEELLRRAAPEEISVDRDALLFQAGLNAARNQRAARFVWPSIAVLLLVSCIGLGAAFFGEQRAASALQRELALLRTEQDSSRSLNQTLRQSFASAEHSNSSDTEFTRNFRIRGLSRLSSNSPLASGQLTAAGWERGVGNSISETQSSTKPEVPPRSRPATYRELLEHYQEG